jgi:uncharacterized membrane protein YeaQ/YmgE (transglycosylase-associated protein family)
MARMCIVSRKEVPAGEGTPIREDAIIRTIRVVKGKLGILQNNELVVSDEALEEYTKKREKFEKMAVIHATVGAILVVAFIFGPLLLGAPFNPMGVLFSIILGLLVAALALLSYVPALDDGKESGVPTPGQIVSRLMPRSLAKKAQQEPKSEAPAAEPAKEAPAKPKKKPYRRKKRK